MIVSSCSTRYNTIFSTSRYSSRASSCLEAGAVACMPAAEEALSMKPIARLRHQRVLNVLLFASTLVILRLSLVLSASSFSSSFNV